MRIHSLNKLEYRRVVETVADYTVTYAGRRLAEELQPMTDLRAIERRMRETDEARHLLSRGGHPPIPSLEGMEHVMALLGTGYVLSETELGHVAQFARSSGQLRQYMASKTAEAPAVAGYASSLYDLSRLRQEIENCVDRGRILDTASNELHKIRKKIRTADERLQKKLEALMSRHADILQEKLVSQRNGRYVLPVKKELRKRISGIVLDESASGQTVFVEPSEIAGLQMELTALRAEESREEVQVLAELTGLAESYAQELAVNVETAGHYDFLFAKARWGIALGAAAVSMNDEGVIRLRQARHPFLAGQPVPLDLEVGGSFRSLLITGPNTGGKTVSLKTVGLLTLMAQSGLLVPAGEGSSLAVFRSVEADIGDDQSLDASLSTFSAHMRNVIDILGAAGRGTLVLMDELATGTDPGEGVGLSIAVLEELYRRGCVVLATTHFNEIKEYARVTPGFRNARMAFDEETLRPLYRLDMGEAGNSYAFVIASKLGISPAIVERARVIAGSLRQGGSDRETAIPAAELASSSPAGKPSGARPRSSPESQPRTLPSFEIGDAVYIPHLGRVGVVYRLPDERGNMVVQIRKEKLTFNHKRVRPYIGREKLYPGEDYDMDIVFDTVENRKKRKTMGKRHVPGLTIETPGEE
ncbi:endonuclease MutS2 [Cohnella caldifontis]|uniref:endonuclease MutS2 n=1 Tax=Cohnella caldifontis TaxID=3027471 RepID=UPI0023EAB7A6|nr:DNA mismatch repair protein MutS [Cohnella sp. YIM B05605]